MKCLSAHTFPFKCTLDHEAYGVWTILMLKILQAHLLRAFVANLKIYMIYALYLESFCEKTLAVRKVFAFSDWKVGGGGGWANHNLGRKLLSGEFNFFVPHLPSTLFKYCQNCITSNPVRSYRLCLVFDKTSTFRIAAHPSMESWNHTFRY